MNNNNDQGRGYYGGGCFAGDCLVRMADGSHREVKYLVKGDKIGTPKGSAEVKCVVKRKMAHGQAEFCELDGGLLITPGHPVKVDGTWVYPRDIAETQTIACDAIYNLVVDQEHIAIVNGVEAILLGHAYTEGILAHPYYGSQRVINDLRQMQGFDSGLVIILTNMAKNQ